MKLYLAGNFVNFVYPEVEKRMMQEITAKGLPYRRLVSFWFYRNKIVNELKNRVDPMAVIALKQSEEQE
jgi:hypothetical protein